MTFTITLLLTIATIILCPFVAYFAIKYMIVAPAFGLNYIHAISNQVYNIFTTAAEILAVGVYILTFIGTIGAWLKDEMDMASDLLYEYDEMIGRWIDE